MDLTPELQGTLTVARSKKPTSPETPEPTDAATPEVPSGSEAPDSGEAATPDATAETPREDFEPTAEAEPLVLGDTSRAEEEETPPEPIEAADIADATDESGQDDRSETEAALPESESEALPEADEPAEAQEEPPSPEPKPAPAAPPPPPPSTSSSFLPLFLGGVAAAAIGFVLARYAVPEGWPTQVDRADSTTAQALGEQRTRIAALEDRLASLSATVDEVASRPAPDIDAGALRDEILAALPEPDLSALDDIQARIAALTDQVAALGDRPAGQPAVGEDQIAAIRAEIDSAVAEARAEMEAAQAQARADLEAAQAEAARIEAEAAAAARLAAAEAALAQVAVALDAGSAYGDVLASLEEAGVDVPPVLAAGADGGVPTLPELQEGFPDAARAALDAAIMASDADNAVDRAIAFLRTQTGARSLTPREGDDPDAILSRAEAALRAGDLDTALSELQALPEAGAAAMADWTAAAETRRAALESLEDLRQRIETN